MKVLLLFCALLVARPGLGQPTPAGEAPTMLADVEDEIGTAHLKLLKKQAVKLKSGADTPKGLVTLTSDNLLIQLNPAKLVGARSGSAKVQLKYTRALKQLREAQKAGHTTIELNQPGTRDLEHLLAAWALPQGLVAAIEWRGQSLTEYTVERYGGGPNQVQYPEGQVFYYYEHERATGFYVYMNVPKTK